MQKTIDTLRPSRTGEFADEVTFFIALRAGDGARVGQMLSRTPELAHAQQQWEPSLVYAGVLPFASRAAALLTRTIERNDLDDADTLLDAGADVDGICGCVTAESPVWAAALLNRTDHLRELLRRGANPNVVAASGNTPLHVQLDRGYRRSAAELLQRGARADVVDARGRTPADWARSNGHPELASLIESLVTTDYGANRIQRRSMHPAQRHGSPASRRWICLRRSRAAAWCDSRSWPASAVVLFGGTVGRRVTVRADGRALWTGFTQRPFDLADWDAEMSELGLDARVERRGLVDFDASPQLRREAFAAGLDRRDAARRRLRRTGRAVRANRLRERRRCESGASVGEARRRLDHNDRGHAVLPRSAKRSGSSSHRRSGADRARPPAREEATLPLDRSVGIAVGSRDLRKDRCATRRTWRLGAALMERYRRSTRTSASSARRTKTIRPRRCARAPVARLSATTVARAGAVYWTIRRVDAPGSLLDDVEAISVHDPEMSVIARSGLSRGNVRCDFTVGHSAATML